MSRKFDSYQKKRLQTSYISVVISISLVLFVLGFFGLIVLKTNELGAYFKEKISMNIFLDNQIPKDTLAHFTKTLESKPYIKEVTFTSKEEAAKMMQKEMGQDFLELLGDNPLKDRIDLKFKSDFVTTEFIETIHKELSQKSWVYETNYNRTLIDQLNKNISRMSLWVLVLSGILTLIVVMLINSTIRLSIYSKRFTIKTMQMVGATKSFIRRPFIWMGIKLGILSSIIAIIALISVGFYVEKILPFFEMTQQYKEFLIVFAGMLVLGVLISWVSTYFATKRFLNLRTEELYY